MSPPDSTPADPTLVDATASGGVTATLPTKPEMPSWRLVVTLAVAAVLSALALSVVNELTRPAIEENRARVLREAVAEVLGGPEAVVSLRIGADGLVPDEDLVYMEEKGVERVYLGYADAAKTRPIGYALVGAAYGYGSDPIKLAFGYDAQTQEILGLKVLEHKETPGIGTKIEDDGSFAGLFWPAPEGVDRPLRQVPVVGRRDDVYDASDPHQVDMISGATISSRAVIKILNQALVEPRPAWLKAYVTEGGE